MGLLILKVCLAPLLVLLATGVQRRWGHVVGGRLAGLPLTSGPIVVILLLDRGTAFAIQASSGMLLGLISGCFFCLCYARVAQRRGWAMSLASGLVGFSCCTVVLYWVQLPALALLGLVGAALLAILRMWPPSGPVQSSGLPRWDLPLRAVCAASMVVLITSVSGVVGPHLAGLAAPLQVIATVVAVFTHREAGGAAAAHFLRGVVQGSFAFAAFFFVLTVTVDPWGAGAGLALACSVAVNIQFATGMIGNCHKAPRAPDECWPSPRQARGTGPSCVLHPGTGDEEVGPYR